MHKTPRSGSFHGNGLAPFSDPTYAFPYKFVGSSLSITNGNTVIVFEPVVAAPATTFAVTTGCNQTGTFVPSPLAPVIN